MPHLIDNSSTWSESRQLFLGLTEAKKKLQKIVLGTLIEKKGSTYRRAGARMLITVDGQSIGLLSGGCLEPQLIESGLSVFKSGKSQIAIFDMMDKHDGLTGFGLGCKGKLEIFLEVIDLSEYTESDLKVLSQRHDEKNPGMIVTVIANDAQDGPDIGTKVFSASSFTDTNIITRDIKAQAQLCLAERRSCRRTFYSTGGSTDCFFHVVPPRPHLVVIGAGDDAQPLVGMGVILDWQLTVLDHRPAKIKPALFPAADQIALIDAEHCAVHIPEGQHVAVVVMTHNYSADLRMLPTLSRLQVGYIGMLGPKRRLQSLISDTLEDVSPNNDVMKSHPKFAKICCPIGLDLGGDSPATIALSIVSQIQSVLSATSAEHLTFSDRPIHSEPEITCQIQM